MFIVMHVYIYKIKIDQDLDYRFYIIYILIFICHICTGYIIDFICTTSSTIMRISCTYVMNKYSPCLMLM